MSTVAIPKHLEHLPRTKAGIPIPHVAAWSSERWGVARMDPLVAGRWALFSEGRQGRGRPLLAVLSEERQRRSVVLNRCQVCDAWKDRKQLWVTTMALHEIELHGRAVMATYAPPTCEPCLEFSKEVCPAFKDSMYGRVCFDVCMTALQLVDPSTGPMNHAGKFDGGDNATNRERLGKIARKHGGLVGFTKLCIPYDELEGNKLS